MTTGVAEPRSEDVLADCVAAYRLPAGLDRRLLWLSKNQESLSDAEREELDAVAFAEDRTLEKLQAEAALRRLGRLYPDIVSSQP